MARVVDCNYIFTWACWIESYLEPHVPLGVGLQFFQYLQGDTCRSVSSHALPPE
jgi:hypothetical protein